MRGGRSPHEAHGSLLENGKGVCDEPLWTEMTLMKPDGCKEVGSADEL